MPVSTERYQICLDTGDLGEHLVQFSSYHGTSDFRRQTSVDVSTRQFKTNIWSRPAGRWGYLFLGAAAKDCGMTRNKVAGYGWSVSRWISQSRHHAMTIGHIWWQLSVVRLVTLSAACADPELWVWWDLCCINVGSFHRLPIQALMLQHQVKHGVFTTVKPVKHTEHLY